jgi:hypothetical protein
MGRALTIAYLSNVVLTLALLLILPARIAVHFGPGGAADGWAPATRNAVETLGLYSLLYLCLRFSPALALRTPPALVNLPNKAYWLSPPHRDAARELIQRLVGEFGTVLFLWFEAVQVLTALANLMPPARLRLGVFLPLFAGFLLYTLAWVLRFYRAFRLPSARGT